MGATLESELHEIFKHGVWSSFPTLTAFRAWQPYLDAGGTRDITTGSRVLSKTLSAAIEDWHLVAPTDALVVEKLLDLGNHRSKRKLNGPDGLRQTAGHVYGVGYDQFRRKYEDGVLASFAAYLETWPGWLAEDQDPPKPEVQIGFDGIERTARDLHRLLEQRLGPDLVITMAGPGSFAACYTMQFNPRDIPVIMAVTFPRRETKTPIEREFARAALASQGLHIETDKWSVYLPGLLRYLPEGYRIALVDDRVLTGHTQMAVRAELEEMGYEVSCAALFSAGGSDIPDLLVGRTIGGEFRMPWGSARGRT